MSVIIPFSLGCVFNKFTSLIKKMKLLWFIVLCVCISQAYSSEKIPIPPDWTELSDDNIEDFRTRFASIKGIHSETLSDTINILKEFRQNFAFVTWLYSVSCRFLTLNDKLNHAQFESNFFHILD